MNSYRYYIDDWKDISEKCPSCGKLNRLDDCGREHFDFGADLLCNHCGERTASVWYPSLDELREIASTDNEEAVRDHRLYEIGIEEHKKSLKMN